jgi:4-hydroxy-tetrahydrodipicolinate synthase
VNVFAPQAREVYDRWSAGDDAEAAQATLTEARAFMDGRALIPALKALMRELTGDDGWLNLRPPLEPLDRGEARDLLAHLPAVARA